MKGYVRSYLRSCVVVSLLSAWVLLAVLYQWSNRFALPPATQTGKHALPSQDLPRGFLVDTDGCRILALDPLDESIKTHLFDDKPVNCAETYGPALVESNSTSLIINESALPWYNVKDLDTLRCCYRPFWRVEVADKYSPDDSKFQLSEKCEDFVAVATVTVEFVRVECFLHNKSIYIDYHAFTPPKVEQQVQRDESDSGGGVSVLVVGVDAVSRLNLHRQMPQTVQFLRKRLHAVEMLGFNKIDDNTFPNIIPVLTGLSAEELAATCWFTPESVFDECRFIWNRFKDIGYTTAFGEDASWMGIFDYLKKGFRKQPTDYYLKAFNSLSEREIGFEWRLNANLCVGPRKNLVALLNYVYKFVVTMQHTLSFGFFWSSSLSHDFLNLPKYGDQDYKQFLESLYNRGIFTKTVLLFTSDHGLRVGDFRKTYQGFLEDRLSFLFVALPEWFSRKYKVAERNLKENSQKLTTPFDIHELFLDLANLTRLDEAVLGRRSAVVEQSQPIQRAISLFLPVPGKRTCADAAIADEWCTCHSSRSVSTGQARVQRAAKYLVQSINSLADYPQCAKLQVKNVLHAYEETPTSLSYLESYVGNTDYVVTVETTPGGGTFVATVRQRGSRYLLADTVRRLDYDGLHSSCMPHLSVRVYCHCI